MSSLGRRLLGSFLLIPWTYLWFLPLMGFHHMWRCGLLGWAIWDAENGEPELRWSGVVLALSIFAWLTGPLFWTYARRRAAAS